MKVLLTGASGFLGSHTARILREAGHEVRALVRRSSKTEHLEPLGVELAYAVLERGEGLAAALDGVDAVVHGAAITKGKTEQDFLDVNEGGTRHLLEAAVTAAPGLSRFVFVSSLEVVGPSPDGRPLPEDAVPRPITRYGRSKLAAEETVRSFADKLPVVTVRPTAIYGPRDTEILELFKVAKLGIVPMLGKPSTKVTVIHGEDCARAILAVLLGEPPSGRVYHLSDGEIYDWAGIADAVAGAFGGKGRRLAVPKPLLQARALAFEAWGRLRDQAVMETREKVEVLTSHQVCTPERLQRELGWEARIPLVEGIRETADWYRAHGWI
jgi:nucleoside-diphosphate-sugar epimerase